VSEHIHTRRERYFQARDVRSLGEDELSGAAGFSGRGEHGPLATSAIKSYSGSGSIN
jgi:hypothetical protein